MAKLLIGLVAVSVVFSSMTFLLVVNQTAPLPEGDAASRNDQLRSTSAAAEQETARLQRLETLVQNLRTSVTEVSRKLDAMQKRLTTMSSRVTAQTPLARSEGYMEERAEVPMEAPPAVRTGPTDYSRVTGVPPAAAAEGSAEAGGQVVEEGADSSVEEPAGVDGQGGTQETIPEDSGTVTGEEEIESAIPQES